MSVTSLIPSSENGGRVRYGTGWLITSITELGPRRYRWRRSPGPARSHPMTTPAPGVRHVIQELPTERVTFILPTEDGSGHEFTLSGGWSAGVGLLTENAPFDQARTEATLRELGGGLRSLHHAPLDADDRNRLASMPGVTRLRRWLERSDPDEDGGLRERCATRLGRSGIDTAVEWARHLADSAAAHARLLHGGVSFANVVAGEGGCEVLTGDDVSLGHPMLDPGWLLGELAEMHLVHSRVFQRPPATSHAALAHSLLAGYGRTEQDAEPWLIRAAALRILLHARDFACYVGQPPVLDQYVELSAELLSSDGAAIRDFLASAVREPAC